MLRQSRRNGRTAREKARAPVRRRRGVGAAAVHAAVACDERAGKHRLQRAGGQCRAVVSTASTSLAGNANKLKLRGGMNGSCLGDETPTNCGYICRFGSLIRQICYLIM